jgi:hypothetical protein
MERVVCVDMLHYLHVYCTITRQQNGFLSDESMVTNLVETFNDSTLAVHTRHAISDVYIVDTVCHVKLLAKLDAIGITGNLHQRIQAFFYNLISSLSKKVKTCLWSNSK